MTKPDLQYTFASSCLDSALAANPRTQEFLTWIDELRKTQSYEVRPINFSELQSWRFEETSGNLVHSSGKFFRVMGLQQTIQLKDQKFHWEQPIVEQPEVGILGFITQIKNGIRYFLMQAKFEPGTLNGLQLAPTVQATHSNYSQVHQGQKPPYIEFFMDLAPEQILFDTLQSEHGCRFYQKRNRNLIIEVNKEIPVKEEFRWMTLREIQELAQIPHLLNMPARSVLAAINYSGEVKKNVPSEFGKKILQSFTDKNTVMNFVEIRNWVNALRAKSPIQVKTVGLKDLKSWTQTASRVEPKPGSPGAEAPAFSIGAVSVSAKIREVSKWTQPLVWCDREPWISGLLTQMHNGVLHCLVQNIFEPGLKDGSELGPTLSYRQAEPSLQKIHPPLFEKFFLEPQKQHIRYNQIQSSEGGRFYHEENRLMILEVEPEIKLPISENHRWISLGQLRNLLDETGWINIELRELMACLSLMQGGH